MAEIPMSECQGRWRLIGGGLGRVYVDAGPPLQMGETVEVVRAEPTEEMVESLAFDLYRDSWGSGADSEAGIRALWERTDLADGVRQRARRYLSAVFSTEEVDRG